METNELRNAHICSSYNKRQLTDSEMCGCFYCLEIFDPKLIVEWCDDDQTAICPYCGVDSIIYDSKAYPLSKDFLEHMKNYWF